MEVAKSSVFWISAVFYFFLFRILLRFLDKVWWTPVRLQAKMNSQGVRGPPYRYPHGNAKEISRMSGQFIDKEMEISHNVLPRIHPHVYAWSSVYGSKFICWQGTECQLFVLEPEMIKEILMNRDGVFPKMDIKGSAKKLLGDSIILNEGEKWEKIRKIANHTFHSESLKKMVPDMSSSVARMLDDWKAYEGKEIDVFKEIGLLTTEIISRTAFASSYMEGKHIFEMVANLTKLTVQTVFKVRFPGIRMIVKSADEIEAEKLVQRIKSSILELAKKREEKARKDGEFGSDYLGQLVQLTHECDMKKRISTEQMIEEIKAIYGAGHLTLTNLLSWTILFLATNTDWQDKARAEVLKVFGKNSLDSDGVSRLKIMNMIINEALRLYPPAVFLTRKVLKEVKIGDLCIPPKINIYIPIVAMHHDRRIWGEDANFFNPGRFSKGIAKATNNNTAAYLPFGLGPRTCVGLNFATNEAKIVLSMILQKYTLALSPNYVHCPAFEFLLKPKNGVQIIINKV
ncbi:cytochrome P450 CYP749A22-like [Andrographis paniculata]|uniref:cytochrome P450 CYP749A22-like n=1 Tax=Andrographis paniculata TaxID=175694 RepID=UPI0021E8D015|nr:cytochrome P450 CYP749A22-like [Andrographis paniculata]